MAEFVRTFVKGKMNQDLDERLVPNGEYRDALNINVSNSEGSDVGAIENVKGNLELKYESFNESTGLYTEWSAGYISDSMFNPSCIGSIADNVSEKIYWFIASNNISAIAEYDKNSDLIRPILVDTQGILNFSKDYLITGINIIEDLLFWTDNQKEPKVLNIKSWINSTENFATHSVIYDRDFIERDIVVIKPAPLNQPQLTLSTDLGAGSTSTNAIYNFTDGVAPNGSLGAAIEIGTSVSINLSSPINVEPGETLNFKCDTPSSEGYEPVDDQGNPDVYTFSISVVSMDLGGTLLNGVLQSGTAELISGSFDYEVEATGEKTLFELTLPRFAYRYKYENNQYSPFSPFSEVAFLPGEFDYTAANGYNSGMTNSVKRIILGDFDSPLPADVVELDILYKQDNALPVYKVDSLSPSDLEINYVEYEITNNSANTVAFAFTNTKKNEQELSVFSTQTITLIAAEGSLSPASSTGVVITSTNLGTVFEVVSELIYSLLPSNQLLRPWDNVPRKAKAQEAISNRIIYGNYLQNYNAEPFLKFDSSNTLVSQTPVELVNSPNKSIKSLRTYQLGIVFKDTYGRETPVFTDPSGVLSLQADVSDTANTLKLKIESPSPKNPDGSEMFDSYKIFIKDPAAEYYNIIVDRLYQSEDGESVWISVPSAETNKVAEGDFIILKKKDGAPIAVKDYPNNKFKILSKKNEAPAELVKKNQVIYQTNYRFDQTFGSGQTQETRQPGATPVAGYSVFLIEGSSNNDGVTAEELVYWATGNKISFTDGISKSQYYEISQVEQDPGGVNELRVSISTPFTTDIDFLYEDPSNPASPLVSPTANTIEISDEVETLGKGQFEGRFFIRLQKTPTLMDNFVSDEELIPLETTVVGRDYDVDRYTIFSGGGGPLQNQSGTQIGSGTRLGFNTGKVYGGLNSGHPNNGGGFGSIWNIPYQPGEYWDFVFERKLTGRGSAGFQKAYKTGAKIRFSTHPDSVYEIKYLHQFTQTSGSSYVRYYTRLDRPLEASISPWQIFRASQDNGNGPVFVDGNQVFVGASGLPPLIAANTDAYVTIDVLRPVDVTEISSSEPAIFETEPTERADLDIYYEISNALPISGFNNQHDSPWFNCYSFGNGVESNRIRDDFNAPYINTGTKANAVLDMPYKEENLTNTLIFSGIFNTTSGINNLNQFIQGEAITKALDPQSGPVQKLFARETDLLAFCEDKVVKILADKDAIYNANGNQQLTASTNVLGQAIIPASFGMFGIGQNPESFANYAYRIYFTDNSKGKVLRLSNDGVTEISNYGMDDFFQDNLPLNNNIFGFYDNSTGTYNLTLSKQASQWSDKFGNFVTISFDESSNGWSSRKSYIPENGISIDTKLYSFKNGLIYEHGKNPLYNNFYGIQYDSSLTFVFNEEFNLVKGFKTINYTGSKSRENVYSINSPGYVGIDYSLAQVEAIKSNGGPTPDGVTTNPGWWVYNAETNLESGSISEFLNKEGKYFNYFKGKNTTLDNISTNDFSVQGIGRAASIEGPGVSLFNVRVFGDPSCAVYIQSPTADIKAYTVQEDCTSCASLILTGTDPQGLPLTFEVVSDDVINGTLSSIVNDQITFTPNVLNYNGSGGSFTYRAFNGTRYSEPALVTVEIAKVVEPPNIDESLLPTGPFTEGDPYNWLNITATDPDHNPATDLVWSSGDLPLELTLTTTGEGFTGVASITGTVPIGDTTYTLRVTDPDNAFDEVVVNIEPNAVPDCPDKTFVLQVCNENASRDDNFDVFLNGTYIGALDLNQDAQIGSVFIGDTNTNVQIGSADFSCPLAGMVTYHFDPSILLGGTNTIFMQNTQDNGNGNQGTFEIRNYDSAENDPNTLVTPCPITNTTFNPAAGQDQTITFEYLECCG
jgi:hypothetical protein